MAPRETEQGQSIVEIAVILPMLLILLVTIAEVGYVLRSYLLISTADREAARFAARGRYSDPQIGERIVSAGGVVRLYGTDVPHLRTYGTEPNTGIIVTHLVLDAEGTTVTQTTWVSGVVASADGSLRDVQSGDSRVDQGVLESRHRSITNDIGTARAEAGYEVLEEHMVTVEVFFAHRPLMLTSLLPVSDVVPLHAHTTARVTTGHQQQIE